MINFLLHKSFSWILIFIFLFSSFLVNINCIAQETPDSSDMISLGGGYVKVHNKIYWRWRQIKSPPKGKPVKYVKKLLSGADPETFVFLTERVEGVWGKDKNYIYFFNEKINGVDIDTWEPLDMGYSKDRNFVYNGTEKIDGNPKTFKIPSWDN